MHLTAALFAQKAQVRIPFDAYRGSAPAANDLLGGAKWAKVVAEAGIKPE
jgi:tripartite-type tricarboxylate transporter receptor subunit TctC